MSKENNKSNVPEVEKLDEKFKALSKEIDDCKRAI